MGLGEMGRGAFGRGAAEKTGELRSWCGGAGVAHGSSKGAAWWSSGSVGKGREPRKRAPVYESGMAIIASVAHESSTGAVG